MPSFNDVFKIQVFGDRSSDWEISLCRRDNEHGQSSWGWCDSDISDYTKCEKILIGTYCESHCSGTMIPEAFDRAYSLAYDIMQSYNASYIFGKEQVGS